MKIRAFRDYAAQNLSLAIGSVFLVILFAVPIVIGVASISGHAGPYGSSSSYHQAIDRVVEDSRNLQSVARSLKFATIASGTQFCLSMILARLLFATRRSWLLPICLVPIALPPIATAMMWKAILDYESGAVNVVFKAIGLGAKPWLSTAPVFPGLSSGVSLNWAQLSVFITDTWTWLPFLVGSELIAFSRVPNHLIESAGLEGATDGIVFWRLACPLSAPYLLIIIFVRFMDSYRTFDTVWAFFGRLPPVEHFSARVYSLGYFERDYLSALILVLIGILAISPAGAVLLSITKRIVVGTAEEPDASAN
jgi:multiple sugar transport system permease protein